MPIPHNVVEWTCLLAWLILLLPLIAFLGTTWRIRRDILFARMHEKSLKLYYEQFFPSRSKGRRRRRGRKSDPGKGDDDLQARFREDFGRLYGLRHYLLPFGLLALISGIGLLVTARSIQGWLGMNPPFKVFPPIAISAFLGAYAWVLFDQFIRFRKGDFTPHDGYSCVFRFLIAIPLGISFAALLKDDVGVAVAFLLAAFPTTTLLTMGRRLVNQRFGLGEEKQDGLLELENLQSVGRANAERYLGEGITTIAELAWADPIDLTIKTNRQFNFVIDSISQALLWVYFEDRVKKLYPLSLRGAQEVCSLLKDLDSSEAKVKSAAEQNLKAAAAIMEMDKESFLYTLLTVRDDPYAQFLFAIWE